MLPEKNKPSLGNFILKELENSVSELIKKPTMPFYSKNPGFTSILNPNAKEFIITNS